MCHCLLCICVIASSHQAPANLTWRMISYIYVEWFQSLKFSAFMHAGNIIVLNEVYYYTHTPQSHIMCKLENFEKVILLKLADKVSFHPNISFTMKKSCNLVTRLKVIRENCWCYLLFYLLWWPRFLISKQHFCWFLLNYLEYSHQISPQKSEKYD